MSLTATYDDQLARVRLAATSLGGATTAVVERSLDEIRWTTVRGGSEVAVANSQASLDDYEFTPGVTNYYRLSVADDPEDFEDDVFEVDISGTWARDSSTAYTGTWSYRSAAISHGQTSDAVLTLPANAGRVDVAYRVSSEEGFDELIILVDATPVFTASGETGWRTTSFPVAGATTVTFRYAKDGSDSEGSDAAWIDNLRITQQHTAALTPVIDRVWIKSIARPFLNRPIVVQDYSNVERPGRVGVFDVIGRSLPVAVSDVRGSRRWTLDVLTETPAEAATLDLILASGDPLFIQVPAGCDVPGGYVAVGDTTVRRTARQTQRRITSMPCIEVAPPGPDVVGATLTWQTVLNTYPTWADVVTTHGTWADLQELIGSPDEVIVP